MLASRPIASGLFAVESDGGPRLLAARCDACAGLHFPATDTCPYCGESASPAPVGPAGTLCLFTSIASKPPGYRGPVPYGFGVVQVCGTPLRVITRLTEPRLDRLRVGLPMRLVIEPLFTDDDGHPVVSYAFAPDVA